MALRFACFGRFSAPALQAAGALGRFLDREDGKGWVVASVERRLEKDEKDGLGRIQENRR